MNRKILIIFFFLLVIFNVLLHVKIKLDVHASTYGLAVNTEEAFSFVAMITAGVVWASMFGVKTIRCVVIKHSLCRLLKFGVKITI